MKASREILEDRLKSQQDQVSSLRSYVNELKALTARHGTDPAQFEDDLREAEHNIIYYEAQCTGLENEIAASAGSKPTQTGRSPAPPSSRPGLSSVIFSSIGFIAGALVGSRVKPRKDK
jgi:hypothetical protein